MAQISVVELSCILIFRFVLL